MKTVLVIIPAYNEEKTLRAVISDLLASGLSNLLVINDGSTDQTLRIAQEKGVRTITHRLNRGLGASLGTGFGYARQTNASVVVTFDADGQHLAQDALAVIEPILNDKADVVIGSRQHRLSRTPVSRIVGNWILNVLTYLLFGFLSTDSQSGLRAFSPKALQRIRLKSNRMEVSSEIFQQIIEHNLRLKEVPIQSVYTEYSLAKGQEGLGALNAVRVVGRLFLRSMGH